MRTQNIVVNDEGNSFFKIVGQMGHPRLPEPENERLRRKREQWRNASKMKYLKMRQPALFAIAEAQAQKNKEIWIKNYEKQLLNEKKARIKAYEDKKLAHLAEVAARKEARRLESIRTKPERDRLNREKRKANRPKYYAHAHLKYQEMKADPVKWAHYNAMKKAWSEKNKEKLSQQRREKYANSHPNAKHV